MTNIFYNYTNNQLLLFNFDKKRRLDTLYCPKGYKICTDDIRDIYNYLLNSYQDNDTCISHPYEQNNTFYTHQQGDWLNLTKSIYPNVTESKSFHLHRFYYSIPSRPKYIPLMNSPQSCDTGYDRDNLRKIKGQSSLNHTGFRPHQCNLTLQNKSVTNMKVEYTEYSKWYPDNDNFIDIITGTNIYMISSDLYNECYNEGYSPREQCGQPDRIEKDRIGFVQSHAKQMRVAYPKGWGFDFVLNAAQSRGYYHFFVEAMPRIAPFIKLFKEVALQNKNNNKSWKHLLHINIAHRDTPKNFLTWLFRHEKHRQITFGGFSNKYFPKFANQLIQPHVTACLWARDRGSMLLNDMVRNEVEIYANEKGVNITKGNGMKNIVLLKRHSRRHIENFDELRSAIESVYTIERGYNLYIHDDWLMRKVGYFDYYVAFYNADIVIGAFGAGLVNVVFSKPGTAVILIQGSRHKNHRMYMAHSMALGMKYYAYVTDTMWKINVTEVMKVIDIYA